MAICVCTAFTTDYTIGNLCAHVNRRYAVKLGYEFISRVLSYDEMMVEITPRAHCTWYKVLLILELLENNEYSYIAWIDADAVVVDHSISLEQIIHNGEHKELILAENMNAGFLVNAGVLLVKNSDWSRSFLRQVWEHTKYQQSLFYEQSALLHILKQHREGLFQTVPFHSFLGGPLMKSYPHVFVYPHMALNTNRGWVFPKKSRLNDNTEYSVHEGEAEEACAEFIFHAAGMRNKLSALRGVLLRFGILLTDDMESEVDNFRLFRNSCGGRATVAVEKK